MNILVANYESFTIYIAWSLIPILILRSFVIRFDYLIISFFSILHMRWKFKIILILDYGSRKHKVLSISKECVRALFSRKSCAILRY